MNIKLGRFRSAYRSQYLCSINALHVAREQKQMAEYLLPEEWLLEGVTTLNNEEIRRKEG